MAGLTTARTRHARMRVAILASFAFVSLSFLLPGLAWADAPGSDASNDAETLMLTAQQDADAKSAAVEWDGFAQGGKGAVIEDANVPDAGDGLDVWNVDLADEEAEFTTMGDPLIIDGKVYTVSTTGAYGDGNARLTIVDSKTGAVDKKISLAASMGYTCRPTVNDGAILIPLADGKLQALSISTLQTLWMSDGIEGSQSLSTLTTDGDYVYVATADTLDENWRASSGTIRRYDTRTGELSGSTKNDESGYYWAGGLIKDGCFIMPDDSGAVTAYTLDLSKVLSTLKVSDASIRTTLMHAGDLFVAVSSDGVMHKLGFIDGKLAKIADVRFAASSTSTPTVVGNTAYVGGATSSYGGLLCAVDLDDMTVVSISKADGSDLPGSVQSTPLVNVDEATGAVSVYFTSNAEPGAVYCYVQGDAEAKVLYAPQGDLASYCLASVIADPYGMLYYTNDSGHLFGIKGPNVVFPGIEEPDEVTSGANDAAGAQLVQADFSVQQTSASLAPQTGDDGALFILIAVLAFMFCALACISTARRCEDE